mmetsp:Transcript_16024/g.34717  ORF Transcript_16024/g.34717 Transcript_16024/m.34717 type:complete len:119 (-) Transcript_16024:629-985(-)
MERLCLYYLEAGDVMGAMHRNAWSTGVLFETKIACNPELRSGVFVHCRITPSNFLRIDMSAMSSVSTIKHHSYSVNIQPKPHVLRFNLSPSVVPINQYQPNTLIDPPPAAAYKPSPAA